ncbi:MAG: hypothetical protein ABEJ58_08800 [Halodesulfurarchaeum sp.]
MNCPTCGYEFDPEHGLECPRCGETFSCASLSCGECGACPSFVQGVRTAIASVREAAPREPVVPDPAEQDTDRSGRTDDS